MTTSDEEQNSYGEERGQPKDEQQEDQVADVTKGMSSLKLNHLKPRPFTVGENFTAFCSRFKQYIYMSKIEDPNLYIYFLQLLDDRTYQKLASVKFQHISERGDPEMFCIRYTNAYYPNSAIQSLQTEVLSCTQKATETIDDYSFRLAEKAGIAFHDEIIREINGKIAFLKGVRNPEIRRKLNEAEIASFDDAVEMAKRLERVDILMGESTLDSVSNFGVLNPTEGGPSRLRSRRSRRDSDRSDKSRSGSRKERVRFVSDDSSGSGSHEKYRADKNSRRDGRSRREASSETAHYNYERRASSPHPQQFNRSSSSRGGASGRWTTRGKSNFKCYYCSKPGHFARECYSNPESRSFRGNHRGSGRYPRENSHNATAYSRQNEYQQSVEPQIRQPTHNNTVLRASAVPYNGYSHDPYAQEN